MSVTRKGCGSYPSYIETGSYKFEIVHSFTQLGLEIKCKNNISFEVQTRILSAGRAFHGLRKILRSQLVSRKMKLLIYKALVRPVIMYASGRRRRRLDIRYIWMSSSVYQNLVNFIVCLSIRRCPSKFMNITMWEYGTFDSKIFESGKVYYSNSMIITDFV
jgi:hypothetical protein